MEGMLFSNRELACVIWLLPLSIWLLSKPSIRVSCKNLLRAFAAPAIACSLLLMLLYTSLLVWGLHALQLWNVGLLKHTAVWFVFTALVMVMRFVGSPPKDNVFTTVIKDNVKVIVLLEFIVNAYSFSLLGELILVPVATIIAVVNAVAGISEKHLGVLRVTNVLLAVIGVALLSIAVANAIDNYQQFGTSDKLREFVLPPLLSILFSPLVFMLALYATYEQAFLRLRLGGTKPQCVLRYAQRKIIQEFGLRIGRLNVFLSSNPRALMSVKSKKEVDELFESGR